MARGRRSKRITFSGRITIHTNSQSKIQTECNGTSNKGNGTSNKNGNKHLDEFSGRITIHAKRQIQTDQKSTNDSATSSQGKVNKLLGDAKKQENNPSARESKQKNVTASPGGVTPPPLVLRPPRRPAPLPPGVLPQHESITKVLGDIIVGLMMIKLDGEDHDISSEDTKKVDLKESDILFNNALCIDIAFIENEKSIETSKTFRMPNTVYFINTDKMDDAEKSAKQRELCAGFEKVPNIHSILMTEYKNCLCIVAPEVFKNPSNGQFFVFGTNVPPVQTNYSCELTSNQCHDKKSATSIFAKSNIRTHTSVAAKSLGIEDKHIISVMTKAMVTRGLALHALEANNNNIDESVSYLKGELTINMNM